MYRPTYARVLTKELRRAPIVESLEHPELLYFYLRNRNQKFLKVSQEYNLITTYVIFLW